MQIGTYCTNGGFKKKDEDLSISLILLGAGNSTRFGLPVKKQWLRLGDMPLWLYVSKKISSYYEFDKVICVGGEDEIGYMERFCDYKIVKGGNTRQESLKRALSHVDSKYVIVSDIARVCVDKKLLFRLINSKHKADCVVPVLNSVDTIYFENRPIKRERVKSIQTPQLSNTKVLKNALKSKKEFTDDSSAISEYGGKVKFVKGSKKALKLTCSEDLKLLDCIKKPSSNTFVGQGFDVHAFGEVRPLLLGGVKVHESMGLKAHSDGDVLAHALTDALLGAMGAGDIGEIFPDTDEEYKNADSMELLRRVYEFCLFVGFSIVNCDITILAQNPKINPFKKDIVKSVAKCLDLERYFVNIKASTTEKLGFVGREEGIAVMATICVKFYNWTGEK